jgi:hypothetical protein
VPLRSADDLLAPAVEKTLAALTLSDQDTAAVRLVREYAAAIDADKGEHDALDTYGPKLLAALSALGATPAARARLKAGGAPSGPNRLEALRAARRA